MSGKAKSAAKKSEKKAKKVQASKSEEQKDQDFLTAYEVLCKRHRRELNATPGFRFSQDGNDYRVVIQMQVARWREDVQIEKK